MRSEKTRSTHSSLAALVLLASGMACSVSFGADQAAQPSRVDATQLQGREVRSIHVDDVTATTSKGTVVNAYGLEQAYQFESNVIVRSNDWDAVRAMISNIQGATLGKFLDNDKTTRVVHAPNVGTAFQVQRVLNSDQSVQLAEIDSGNVSERPIDTMLRSFYERRMALLNQQPQVSNRGSLQTANQYVGVRPADPNVGPQTLLPSMWNFTGTSTFGLVGNDNNILETIYTTRGLTGAGVNVGVSSLRNNIHLDVDHSELVNPGGRTGGYLHNLSQTADLNLTPDAPYITSYAGIISAERNAAGLDFQGVAPGSGVATLYRGPTPLFESQGYEWQNQALDIKVHQLVSEFDTPTARYNETGGSEFVRDSFTNSTAFGRNRKGTIHIFGTGVTTNLMPDPYNIYINDPDFGGPTTTSQPWDAVTLNPNAVSVTLTNGFTGMTLGDAGPLPDPMVTLVFRNSVEPFLEQFYVGGQTHQFTLANSRNSLIIQSVSEDGNVDSFGSVGPGVFASVFTGTSNELFSLAQGVSGRGIQAIGASDATGVLLPAGGSINDLVNSNMTGASTAAGIVALMLEANPRLKVRDIQHIFFESIQESTKAAATKWPNFDSTRIYYVPDTGLTNRSFWQVNNGFYNAPNATPPVVNQSIRHSDQYGFGMIDADLAIQKASTWSSVPPLILLDSGLVGDVNLGDDGDDESARVPVPIIDAIWSDPNPEPDGEAPGTDGQTFMIVDQSVQQIRFCVRDNIRIESIVVELTIEGGGSNDLFITLTSPTGSQSILALPTTLNLIGTSSDESFIDDDLDTAFTSGDVNGTTYAYYQHPFLTHKHWGELSGGSWSIDFADYGPDTPLLEGAEPGDDIAMEPGADMIHALGEIGIPGSNFRSEKTVTAFRVKMYGTDTGVQPFLGCDPFTTSCPADLNGDGVINIVDLHLFINWYQNGDARADISGDGQIDFGDVQAFLNIFNPGYCVNSSTPPLSGGRPVPGSTDVSDSNPTTRPF